MSEEWVRCIQLIGPEDAKVQFRKANDLVPFPESHQRAHQFGYALNHLYGVAGVRYCTWKYQGGCTHGVIASEIIKRGPGVATSVGAECEGVEKSPMHRNCYHSLGHGFVSIFGLDEQDLKEALEQCDALHSESVDFKTHREDCYEGAFMEYNQRTLYDEQSPRKLAPTDIYGPCVRLEEKYKSACYFRLTRLWAISAGTSTDAVFKERVKWCKLMPDPMHHARCIEGVNTSMGYARVTSDTERFRLCAAMYSDSSDRDFCEEAALLGP